MQILDIQPDEWIEGYIGRLARWNGMQSRAALKANLLTWVANTGEGMGPPLALLPALATAAKLSLENVATRHTLWPAHCTVGRPTGREFFIKMFGKNSSPFMLKRARDDDWLCPACAVEHLPESSISFWHRKHQIPGQMHCQSHGAALRRVDRLPILLAQPHEALAYSQEPESSLRDSVTGNEHIARATAIQSAIVEERVIASRDSARRTFSARAAELRFARDSGGRFPEVRELVERNFPIAWLRHSLQLTSRSRPESLKFVDLVFMRGAGPVSGLALSVVAATLFDSASSAVGALRYGSSRASCNDEPVGQT